MRHADPWSSGECRSKCILDGFAASIEALPKVASMSARRPTRGQRNIAISEPPSSHVPFSQGGPPMSHHIAFLGTGIMGAPMAANLIKAGFKAAVWNRTRSKTDPLAVQGARVAAGPVDCVKGADYILSILDSGPVVREVFFDSGAADAMKRGAVFIDMASIPPKMAQEHACRAQNCSLESLFLDDAEQHQPPACPTTCGRGQRFAVCCGPLLPRCGQGCCLASAFKPE